MDDHAAMLGGALAQPHRPRISTPAPALVHTRPVHTRLNPAIYLLR